MKGKVGKWESWRDRKKYSNSVKGKANADEGIKLKDYWKYKNSALFSVDGMLKVEMEVEVVLRRRFINLSFLWLCGAEKSSIKICL